MCMDKQVAGPPLRRRQGSIPRLQLSSCEGLCYDVTSFFQQPTRSCRVSRKARGMTTSSLLSSAAEGVEVAVELRGPLVSRLLEKSPAMKRLLVYLWEHRAEELNEYAIATEALDRRSDFDPRTDAAVRVQVARL